MLPARIGEWLPAILLAVALGAVTAGAWYVGRITGIRRLAWVLCGLAGAPITVLGMVYLIGIPVVVAVFVIGMAAGYWRRTGHGPFVAYGIGCVALGAYERSEFDSWVETIIAVLMILAALLAISKLGRMLAVALREDRSNGMFSAA